MSRISDCRPPPSLCSSHERGSEGLGPPGLPSSHHPWTQTPGAGPTWAASEARGTSNSPHSHPSPGPAPALPLTRSPSLSALCRPRLADGHPLCTASLKFWSLCMGKAWQGRKLSTSSFVSSAGFDLHLYPGSRPQPAEERAAGGTVFFFFFFFLQLIERAGLGPLFI